MLDAAPAFTGIQPRSVRPEDPLVDSGSIHLEIGCQAPPSGGYDIELFKGYLREMEDHIAGLGGRKDPRAVFETTYLVFSRTVLGALEDERFEDMPWATDLACRFLEVYHAQRSRWEERQPELCQAWRVAFEAMEEGQANVVQAMLLGINAHINYDLAFATLGACLHAGDIEDFGSERDSAERLLGFSRSGVPMVRYRDFLVINQLEWEAIELIQDTILRDYNKVLYWGNRLTKRTTRFMGQRILMEARDAAWYQTTLLVHARSDEERALAVRLIDAYAASIGDLIGTFTHRIDDVKKSLDAWRDRGERIEAELRTKLVDMARRNPMIAELVLHQLAFSGAEPVSVLTKLIDQGERRLAALFGRLVLDHAPIRRKRALRDFLRAGCDDAVTIVEVLLLNGLRAEELPAGAPVESVRRRWTSRLGENIGCLELPEVQFDDALREALAVDTRTLRLQLHDLGGADHTLDDRPRLDLPTATPILSRHLDPWVRTCAQSLLDPPARQAAGKGDTMSSTIERVLFLKETELFLEVEISTLMHVANALEARFFDVGKTIIRKDEYTGGIYLITEGEVEVSQCRKSKSLGIATLSVHDAIGELSALNGTPASAYCRASTPVKCWFLPAKVLADLLHLHPRLSIGIVRMLSQRLVSTTLQVQAGAGADPSDRLVDWATSPAAVTPGQDGVFLSAATQPTAASAG